MRIAPYDLLTQEDKKAYIAYLQRALDLDTINPKASLCMGNKHKRTLFKALGNKLRVSYKLDLRKSPAEVNKLFREVYPNRYPYSRAEWKYLYRTRKHRTELDFPFLFIDYLVQTGLIDDEQLRVLANIFEHENIRIGYLEKEPYKNKNIEILDIKIKGGEKTIKLIGKLVKKSGFDDIESFEKWRNKMSDITTTITTKSKLVISIHPLDFLSLSDNNSSWNSCYQLLGAGMHKEATISHMNSNCAVVAYLESSTPFEVEGFRIPNKNFRQIFYVHKDIICGGRSYPFGDSALTEQIIDILQKLVYNNLKWKYQYPFQKYKDMLPVENNTTVCDADYRGYDVPDWGNHIFLYLGHKSGYNDIIEHKDEDFYCVRNWVPKNKYIRVTGPLTCVKCGKKQDELYYNTSLLTCEDHETDKE